MVEILGRMLPAMALTLASIATRGLAYYKAPQRPPQPVPVTDDSEDDYEYVVRIILVIYNFILRWELRDLSKEAENEHLHIFTCYCIFM